MRILLTGANGFLGNHIRNFFENKLWQEELICVVRNINQKKNFSDEICDLTKVNEVKKLLDELEPDCIIHAAANPNTKPEIDRYQATCDNINSTINLIEHAKSGCRFIFLSTILIYDANTLIINEESILGPSSDYGAGKLSCEAFITSATKRNLINGVNLRLTATVGSGLSHGILYDMLRKVQNDDIVTVLGECPGSSKPFTHVDDVVSAINFMVLNPDIVGNYNVGPEDNISSLEIAQLTLQYSNVLKALKFLGASSTWAGDNKFLRITADKLIKLGWNPTYNTSQKAIIQAIKDNNEQFNKTNRENSGISIG